MFAELEGEGCLGMQCSLFFLPFYHYLCYSFSFLKLYIGSMLSGEGFETK